MWTALRSIRRLAAHIFEAEGNEDPTRPGTISLLFRVGQASSQSLQRTAKGRARKPRLGNLVAALEAQTVGALFKAHQRLVRSCSPFRPSSE